MSNTENQDSKDKTKAEQEEERIAKWRAERAEVAAREKAERIKAKEALRAKEAEEKEQSQTETVATILPTQEQLEDRRSAFLRKQEQRRLIFIRNFVICVIVPSLVFFTYHFFIATPLYSAKSLLIVTSKAGENASPTLGGLTGLASPAQQMDTHAALSYLQSSEILTKLDLQSGTLKRLASSEIDPLYRLTDYSFFRGNNYEQANFYFKSAIDSQSGLITLEVKDPDPQLAASNSLALIALTSEKISQLGTELYRSRIINSDMAVQAARERLQIAQDSVTDLQIKSGMQDPMEYLSSIYAQIRELNTNLLQLQNEIEQARASSSENNPLIRNRIKARDELQNRIQGLRTRLVTSEGETNLNDLIREYNKALLEVDIASKILAQTLQAQASTQQEASLGRSLVQVVVAPRVNATPIHPTSLKSTFFCFIILTLLYLGIQLFRKP